MSRVDIGWTGARYSFFSSPKKSVADSCRHSCSDPTVQARSAQAIALLATVTTFSGALNASSPLFDPFKTRLFSIRSIISSIRPTSEPRPPH